MELNIPEGINYECTGCGKCCSGWSVPLTPEDYERLAVIDWGALSPDLKDKKLFSSLKSNAKLNSPYTHAINPEANGQCPFLKNNLCFIHSQFGPSVKPAICQLFPYSFNETPSGIFATVSFISRGAIFNAGRSLLEQKEYLKSKYAAFQKLFPDHHPNWSVIKLSSNIILSWSEYLEIEKKLLDLMKDTNQIIENRFIKGSIYLNSLRFEKLANQSANQLANKDKPPQNNLQAQITDAPEKTETEKVFLNKWDKIILLTLYKKYFADERKAAKGYGQLNLDLPSFIHTSFNTSTFDKLMSENNDLSWTEAESEIRDLVYRFFYSHIFAKLYFGAGFGQLSVIAGFNHLALTLFLLKLKARQKAKLRGAVKISMDDVVSSVVQLEKSLGELKISPYGAAIMELLLSSQRRISRILSLSQN